MKTPKILIMLMSCNVDIYKQQENLIKETWINDLSNYDNIDYVFYKGGNDTYIDKFEHQMVINCDDSIERTFTKTFKAFELADTYYDYDYIVRSNISNYINIKMLNKLLTFICNTNDNSIIVNEINHVDDVYYPVGRLLIFNRSHIKYILNSIDSYDKLNEIDSDHHYDDVIFGKILTNVFNYIQINWCSITRIDGHPSQNTDFNNLGKYLFISYKKQEYDIDNSYLAKARILYNIMKNVKTEDISELFNYNDAMKLIWDHNTNKYIMFKNE